MYHVYQREKDGWVSVSSPHIKKVATVQPSLRRRMLKSRRRGKRGVMGVQQRLSRHTGSRDILMDSRRAHGGRKVLFCI